MIRKRNGIIFFVFIALNSFGQAKHYFEGKITYKLEFDARGGNVTVATFQRSLGNGVTLFFKHGNYYHRFDGGIMEYDMYNQTENKLYTKMRNNDTIFWSDCSLPEDKILGLDSAAKKESILGIKCNELTMRQKDMTHIQYYNSDSITINPDWFKNFRKYDQYLVSKKESSIYLKEVTFYGALVMIETAIAIKREPIDD